MEKQSPEPAPSRRRHAADDPELIDWHEPAQNARVLDWRQRAEVFGLNPDRRRRRHRRPRRAAGRAVDRRGGAGSDGAARVQRRRVGGAGPGPDDDEPADARLQVADTDPVRVYLQEIGKRRLLTSAQEQEIGGRIEAARAALLAELPLVPRGLCCLLSLADTVRSGEAPAAELILLPDGGELTPGHVQPVLDALAQVDATVDDDRGRRRGRAGPGPGAAPRPADPPVGHRRHRRRAADPGRGVRQRGRLRRPRPAGAARGRADRRQAPADRAEPAPGRVDRQALPESRAVAARPDPGREHRPDEGGRPLPAPPRPQVLDLRDVVDPPGHHPRDRRLRPHHPPAGAHLRVGDQAVQGAAGARRRARTSADHDRAGRRRRASRSTR